MPADPGEAMRARAAAVAREAREAARAAALQAERLAADLKDASAATIADRAAVAALSRLLMESQRREGDLRSELADATAEAARLQAECEALRLRPEPRRDLELILGSGLFDAAWYRSRYPDAAASGVDPTLHFLRVGLGRNDHPGPAFDTQAYLAAYPDVAASGMNPLLHYLKKGAAEGRTRFPLADAAAVPPPGLPPRLRPVLLLISGEPNTPGHAYRVTRLADAAAVAGYEPHVFDVPGLLAHLDAVASADLLAIWRAPLDDALAAILATARAAGLPAIYDLDDLMTEPDLARPAVIDGIRSQGLSQAQVRSHYTDIRAAMLQCDFCLASTEELAATLRRHAKPTLVLPNGYDQAGLRAARLAVRRREQAPADGLLRIGYAAGSRTHQRDLAVAAPALAAVLAARPDARLVLFRDATDGTPLTDPAELPELAAVAGQIEWRALVPLAQLPEELARFDVNIAPLEPGNPFCEAKSELKYFEAALVDVPTLASATGPFRRAIAHGHTGLLAEDDAGWHDGLARLLDDAGLRQALGRAAQLDVLWRHGPERRAQAAALALQQAASGAAASLAFAHTTFLHGRQPPRPDVPDGETLFLHDALGEADVTVVVPLYNYAHFLEEALESVRAQTLSEIDLIVIDDVSTDDGLALALDWTDRHRHRFNRLMVWRNSANVGLGLSRNAGFALAETAYVLPLDADNRLRPACCTRLLAAARSAGAAFAYPVIRQFGADQRRMGDLPYAPARLIGAPFIDAMALVARAAWAGVGGYGPSRLGWEDYDFWCRMAEAGLHGVQAAGAPLAEYRVHGASMLHTVTETPAFKPQVVAAMTQAHPWLALVDPSPTPPSGRR